MLSSDRDIRAHWRYLAEAVGSLGLAALQDRRREARRQLRESGVTYTVYDDPEGRERPPDPSGVAPPLRPLRPHLHFTSATRHLYRRDGEPARSVSLRPGKAYAVRRLAPHQRTAREHSLQLGAHEFRCRAGGLADLAGDRGAHGHVLRRPEDRF